MSDLETVCRICLVSDAGELHNIFDESLSNKIIIITGLEVQTDTYPKSICTNCRFQLEKSYYFRILAKQSDLRLRKFLRLKNQNKEALHVLQRDYKDDDIEEFEEQLVETNNYLEDIKQQIEEEKRKAIYDELVKLTSKFESPKRSENHQPRKLVSDRPVVLLNKCPNNATPSSSVPAIRRKRKADEMEEQIPIEIGNVQMIDNGKYEIRIIQADAEGGQEVQFLEIERSENDEEFKMEGEIVEEIQEILEDVPKNTSQVKKQKLSAPIIMKQEIVQNTASECYFKVIDESEEPELDENNEKKIFQCAFENCNVTFARRQACKTHYYNHLAVDSNYSCQYCSKKFKVQSALERHERVHNASKPFKCETCNKGFSQKEMLKRHLMIHLPIEEAQFACKVCDKRFRQKDPLRRHMLKVHSDVDVPKFQCNLCDKSFAHSSGLSRHLLLHSGKTFTCEECKRPFTDKSALKRHSAIHSKSNIGTS